MNSRETQPAVAEGTLSIPGDLLAEPPLLSVESATREEGIDDSGNYVSVPPRVGSTILVQVRPGQWLKPLPYPLDDEEPA